MRQSGEQNNTVSAEFGYNVRMDKTVVIPPKATPQSSSRAARAWLLYSCLIFIGLFVIDIVVITLLNKGWVNHVLNPVGADFSMFQLIWPEQPLTALEFILTKSFIVFAHQDPRSALNLWTLEYDAITLTVYFVVSLLIGRMLSRAPSLDPNRNYRINTRGRFTALLGAGLLVLSVTYMTGIEHCSGATWVGFVSLYGMGFDGFDLYPIYQWIIFIVGVGLLAMGLRKASA